MPKGRTSTKARTFDFKMQKQISPLSTIQIAENMNPSVAAKRQEKKCTGSYSKRSGNQNWESLVNLCRPKNLKTQTK